MLIIACILSGTVGALGMAIFSAGAYSKGYDDGLKFGELRRTVQTSTSSSRSSD
jgi:hypothetical protein